MIYCANAPIIFFLIISLGLFFGIGPDSVNSIFSASWYMYIKCFCVFVILLVFNYLVWKQYHLAKSGEGYPKYLYYFSPIVFFLSVSLCISVWEHWYGSCVDIKKNPAIHWEQMPDFSQITPQHLEQGCLYALRETSRRWKFFVKEKSQKKDILSFLEALEEVYDPASKVLSALHHLHSVSDSPEIRRIHSKYVHKFDPLFKKLEHFPEVKSFYDNRKDLSPVLAKIVKDIYEGLVDIGANLPLSERKKYLALCEESQKLGTSFGQNLLDESQSYELWLKKTDLDGLSEDFISLIYQSNVSKDLQKEEKFWKISLSPPVVNEFLTYSKRPDLRENVYRAYASRATSGKKNNTPIVKNILDIRFEVAKIMGYSNYASYSLRTEMANNEQAVFNFLQGIHEKSFKKAAQEYEELQLLKKEIHGDGEVYAWDFSYLSEILKKRKYDISNEITRPYFPKEKVLQGLFSVLGEMFGFVAICQKSEKKWHPDVMEYSLVSYDQGHGEKIGTILFDLYAREGKRSGGWMGHFSSRYKDSKGEIHDPVAYIVCNFRPPLKDEDAYLTLEELETLFHEVGHALHHVLSLQDHREVSGMSGVPHDAVEFPSQFMENWLWQEKTLQKISSHKVTGETIPKEMVLRLKNSKNFQSGLFLVRQIYFGLMDMNFHTKFCELREKNGSSKDIDVRKMSKDIAAKILPYKTPDFSCFENTFSHIFDGGYAAGYYGYLWSEVLAADAFEYFEENGVFNKELGKKFRNIILGGGGSKPFMELYKEFRGKDPEQGPLLKQMGIR